jgi:hypothetical protein
MLMYGWHPATLIMCVFPTNMMTPCDTIMAMLLSKNAWMLTSSPMGSENLLSNSSLVYAYCLHNPSF